MLAVKRCLMIKQRRTFSPEFKQQAASLVLDQGYSHMEASRSVGVGETVLRRWVHQLQQERQGVTPQGKAITRTSNIFRNSRHVSNALGVRRPF
jgi:transposase